MKITRKQKQAIMGAMSCCYGVSYARYSVEVLKSLTLTNREKKCLLAFNRNYKNPFDELYVDFTCTEPQDVAKNMGIRLWLVRGYINSLCEKGMVDHYEVNGDSFTFVTGLGLCAIYLLEDTDKKHK